MSLREQIAGFVGGFHTYMKKWERIGGGKPSAEICADRIISAFEQALLQPEVVEAAARAIHSTEHLLVGKWEHPYVLVLGKKYETDTFDGHVIDEDTRDGYRYTARASLQAALAAMKGAEGETS